MIVFIVILLLLAAAVGAAYYFTQKQTRPSVDSSAPGPSTSLTNSNIVITGEQETETDEVVGQSVDEINELSNSLSNKMSDI